jgi:hypothetical protein
VYKWGENGVLTVPKPDPIGRYNAYVGGNFQSAGSIEGAQLVHATGTFMIGLADNVDFGVTHRALVWDDLARTDLRMNTFHFKARILHLADWIFPQVGVGINATSLSENRFDDRGRVLFNPYVTATSTIPLDGDHRYWIALTAMMESAYVEGASARPFFNFGADIAAIPETLHLVTELQGFTKTEDRAVLNAGARLRYRWGAIGLGAFNLIPSAERVDNVAFDSSRVYLMANATIDLPFSLLFAGGSKESK